jgi:hypothetical protein
MTSTVLSDWKAVAHNLNDERANVRKVIVLELLSNLGNGLDSFLKDKTTKFEIVGSGLL